MKLVDTGIKNARSYDGSGDRCGAFYDVCSGGRIG